MEWPHDPEAPPLMSMSPSKECVDELASLHAHDNVTHSSEDTESLLVGTSRWMNKKCGSKIQ